MSNLKKTNNKMDSNRKIKVIAFNPSVKLKSIEYAEKKN